MSSQQAATGQNRQTHSRGARPRLFALWMLILLIFGAGAWWARGLLMQWGLQQLLQRPPLSDSVVSGVWFDFNQARLNSLQFGLRTDAGPVSVQLEDVRARYDLRGAKLDSVQIAKADLRISYQPTVTGGDSASSAVTVPELPLQRITIDRLDLQVDTPEGVVGFNGSAELNISPEHAIQIVFQDAEQSVRLVAAPDLGDVQLLLEHNGVGNILQLDYRRLDPLRHQAKLDADASLLLNWLSNTNLIPTILKQRIAASELARAAPNMSAMKLNLAAESPDNLQTLQSRLLLTQEGNYRASADLTLKTANMRLNADAHLDLTTVEIIELLKPWLPETVNAWRFATGNVMATVRFEWKPKSNLTGSAYLRAYHLGIGFGALQVEDGFVQLDIKDLAKLSIGLSADVPKLLLGKETTVRDLMLKAHYQKNLLTLESVILPVFGGVLEILPTTFDIEQRPVNLTLGVKNVDMSQLLDSLNYPALSGTGTLNGKLPLRLTSDTIEVSGGVLEGAVPGVLRYQGPVADDENIAFKALRNMLYHSLQAKVNYRPNGEYQIGLRMEGKNPQLLSGHPVAFNLNLSGQLPELLQKGILAGDFDQSVLEQVNGGGQH